MWQQVEQSLHSSMGLVMNKIATLLPGILAFIVAFLFFLLIGWLLSVLVTSHPHRAAFRRAHGPAAPTPWPSGARALRRRCWSAASSSGASSSPASWSAFPPIGHLGAHRLRLDSRLRSARCRRGHPAAGGQCAGALRLAQRAHHRRQSQPQLRAPAQHGRALDDPGAHRRHGARSSRAGRARLSSWASAFFSAESSLRLSLAVGLGSRDLVSRSLEREAARPVEVAQQPEKIHHF